jgi:hypothetical protein
MDDKHAGGSPSGSGSGGQASPAGSTDKVGLEEEEIQVESPTTSMSTHRAGESRVDLGEGMGSTVHLAPRGEAI